MRRMVKGKESKIGISFICDSLTVEIGAKCELMCSGWWG